MLQGILHTEQKISIVVWSQEINWVSTVVSKQIGLRVTIKKLLLKRNKLTQMDT